MENDFKLIKLSKKSWHYRLMRWFLGDNTPNPSNTFNFCRYFWVFMFCLLILTPLYGPIKIAASIIGYFFNQFIKFVEWNAERGLKRWVDKIDKTMAADIHEEGAYGKVPKRYRNLDGAVIDAILARWAKNTFGLDWSNLSDRDKIKFELRKIQEERAELEQEENKYWLERQARAERREKKRKEILAKINSKLSFVGDGWDKFTSFVSDLFNYDYTRMINVAKKTFGILITILFLITAYFLVNFMVFGIIWLTAIVVASIIPILVVFGSLVGVAIIGAIGYLAFNGVVSWGERLIDTYKGGGSIWYIQIFYWGIFKPLEYIVYKPLYWFTIIPLNLIFKHVLWDLVVMRWIVPFAIWVWRGFVNFTGIFGIYFSASKGDYCPGIEWEDE